MKSALIARRQNAGKDSAGTILIHYQAGSASPMNSGRPGRRSIKAHSMHSSVGEYPCSGSVPLFIPIKSRFAGCNDFFKAVSQRKPIRLFNVLIQPGHIVTFDTVVQQLDFDGVHIQISSYLIDDQINKSTIDRSILPATFVSLAPEGAYFADIDIRSLENIFELFGDRVAVLLVDYQADGYNCPILIKTHFIVSYTPVSKLTPSQDMA
jgi:hypothetical protein